jgi:Uma2 family endonuclease
MTVRRAKVRFNYRDYCLLSEDKRYELIDGELYMAPAPSIRHQTISRDLGVLLWDYVKEGRLGQVYFAPVDVILPDEDVVQPDLLFVAQERQGIISKRGCEGPADRVVAVLSLSTQVMELEAEDFGSQGVYIQGGEVKSQPRFPR